jgi:hypothetical protein
MDSIPPSRSQFTVRKGSASAGATWLSKIVYIINHHHKIRTLKVIVTYNISELYLS